ncbi:MAG: Type secretion system protein N-terminal domain [Chthoniobacter sp.]|jgi:tetratricopeptide (TPR) repeat protein|nr:Type secretion system protein N-terminal domain [Chthoniobacter sp.]
MMTAPSVPNEEIEQLSQTIEMFEVILQANAHDTGSMEILKEAYWKAGRDKDALMITRKLADELYAEGKYASALLEYEGILEKEPGSPDVVAMLEEVEAKLQASPPEPTADPQSPDAISVDFGSVVIEDPTLITTSATVKPETHGIQLKLDDDGNEPLARFLIQHKLAPEDVVMASVDRVNRINKNLGGQALAASLIDEISRTGIVDLDPLLCGILDRSKFAFIPLDCYDVDRQIVKMLPEALTLGRLMVPFDVISRTIMIAVVNPFDAQAKAAAQQLLDFNIQWHLAAPEALTKVLRDTYRLDARA